ncbi:MAG: MMPL family transporter [Deltaproteobacteria bacterium]|nr:MMPL family transporter [Deltaproteobacteria bacterium]
MMHRKPALGSVFLLYRYCAWLDRWHRGIVLMSLVGAIVGGFYSVKLYQNLRTDMEELLPASAQSVKDLKAVSGRVGGLNHISVIIESDDREAGHRLELAVAARLRGLPPTLVARVKDSITDERAFFEKNKALYIDTADWKDVERYVHERIRHEKKRKNPFSLGLDDESDDDKAPSKKPEFDFEALKKKYAQRTSGTDKFPNGFFESRDGKTHVVLAFLPGKVTDISSNERLSVAAHEIVEKLNPRSYAPDMSVGFSGDVQNVVEEQRGLVADLVKSFVIVTVLVGCLLIVFFRSFVGVYALCASLFAGTAWTFGLSYALVGYLNANTAFLGSIVIGNGINFGIIFLARYLEERRRGLIGPEALPRSVGFTVQATWTAAIAAGLSYGSLVITDFRGFNQFGIIGGLGMFLCWLSSFVTLPAMLIWIENLGWLRPRVGEGSPIFARLVSRFVVRANKPITILTLMSIVLAGAMLSRLSRDTLESDFSKLRNKDSILHGSGFWGEKVDRVFERYLTPTIILTTDARDTSKIADALTETMKRDGDNTPISDIKRVEDFVPVEQSRKIKIIGDIKKLLPPRIIAQLSAEDHKLVDELLPKEELNVLAPADLPEGILANFRELDGTVGRMVHIYPKLPTAVSGKNGEPAGFWDGKEVIRFAERLREAVRVAGVGAAIAGQPPLSADMISAIANDGPKATAFAFLAVMLLVVFIFPSWQLSRSILGALVLGVLWMGGVMGAFHLKINFLNFIALPITFGIGVDYAVNIFSRYRLDGARSIASVIENTGGAVVLCSCTTIIGYASLLIAGSQAFVSFGMLAVLGEVTCISAAIFAFPAMWAFFGERRKTARASNDVFAKLS